MVQIGISRSLSLISSFTPPPALMQLPRYTNFLNTSTCSPFRVSKGLESCQSCRSTLHFENAKHIPYLRTFSIIVMKLYDNFDLLYLPISVERSYVSINSTFLYSHCFFYVSLLSKLSSTNLHYFKPDSL
ncbi:unnamed protein product [Schistosoma curassoni]|nr:unnamed protein product [Schistosoma curassoni]